MILTREQKISCLVTLGHRPTLMASGKIEALSSAKRLPWVADGDDWGDGQVKLRRPALSTRKQDNSSTTR